MRLLLRFGLTVLAAATLSCATSMTVGSHVDHDLDLSRFWTFDWGPVDALPTGDARLDRNPYFRDRVQGAVEKGLAAHNHQRNRRANPPSSSAEALALIQTQERLCIRPEFDSRHSSP